MNTVALIRSKDLIREADISYRQCNHWTTVRGWLRAAPQNCRGTGCPARYPESEIAVARLLKAVVGRFDDETIGLLVALVRGGNRDVVPVEVGISLDLGAICADRESVAA